LKELQVAATQCQEIGLEPALDTFLMRSRLEAGIVVRVGEQAISTIGLSIFCWFGQ
jgi:hypothetical protein